MSKGILIRVTNTGELAGKQGFLAQAAALLAPGLIEDKVLEEIRKKLADSLAKEGVKASVTVVNQTAGLVAAPKSAPSGNSSLIGPAALAVGAIVAVAIIRKHR